MRRGAVLLAAAFLLGQPVARGAAVPAPATAPAVSGCADFLAAMHRKPAHLDFVGCTAPPGRQGKPLRATYRVAGRHAAAVEAALVRGVGLARLRRSCCQWDSPPHGFKDAAGRDVTITMISGETPVSRRADWPKVRAFEVVVETLTDDI